MQALPRDRPLFGISVTPSAVDHSRLIQQVLAAERGGLHLVGIQDHPYQRRFFDTFSLIADAETRDIERFPNEIAPAVTEAAGRATGG